jgi:predicted MPP superfamily phosphohydrolase
MNGQISIAERLVGKKHMFKTVELRDADGKLIKIVTTRDITKSLRGYDNAEIVLFGDFHCGNPTTWYKGAWATFKYVYQKPNCFIILMGDLTDVGSSDGCRLLHEMLLTNDEQLSATVRYLSPLAKKGKILLCVNGNHNVNSKLNKEGFDIDEAIVDQLNTVSTIQIPPSTFIYPLALQAGKYTYTFLLAHGYGSGCTNASRITKVESMNKIVTGCDVYALGHGHGFAHSTMTSNVQNTKTIVQTLGTYVMTTGYVQAGDNYIEKMLLPATSTLGSASVTLAASGTKHVTVTPTINIAKQLPTKAEFNKDQYEKFLER